MRLNPAAKLFARTVMARAYPRFVVNFRERWWLMFDIVLPVIALSAYVFVYRSLHAPQEFIGFVILGGAMSAYWLNVLWSMANQLFWERETGNLGLYIMSPTSLMAILLGMAFGGMFATTIRAVAIISIGTFLFDVHYTVSSTPMLIVVFAFGLVALYGMGMMFASLFLLFGREGFHLVNLVQEPVYLVSGTYFPISGLNAWVAAGASLIPLTLVLDAIRQLIFKDGAAIGLLSVRIEVAMLAGLSIVFLVLARNSLIYMERLAITEGRLTESRA